MLCADRVVVCARSCQPGCVCLHVELAEKNLVAAKDSFEHGQLVGCE